jgi:FMN-dependent NADH-azoreductase
MTKILIINSSTLGEQSVSRKLTGSLAASWRKADAAVEVRVRDLGAEPIPHLVPESWIGIRGEPMTEREQEARQLSDALIAEVEEADIIVIGAPMYNFGIPSTLKAWFDHVLRAGVTFRYTPEGPEGLMKGKRAIVIETRGGLYSSGPATTMDSQEPHLRTMLGFMGITDVRFVRVEQLSRGGDSAAAAVARAEEELVKIAGEQTLLAA